MFLEGALEKAHAFTIALAKPIQNSLILTKMLDMELVMF